VTSPVMAAGDDDALSVAVEAVSVCDDEQPATTAVALSATTATAKMDFMASSSSFDDHGCCLYDCHGHHPNRRHLHDQADEPIAR
jgi:hypothetical protein